MDQHSVYSQRIPTSIKIAKLITQVTGTYNPLYSRPYETAIDKHSLDVIGERVDQVRYGNINSETFTGIGSSILRPSVSHHGELPIPYGWTERRCRFIMEVHVSTPTGTTLIYFFQGYTSHDGISPSTGAIDPQMEFVINSFIRVTRSPVYNPLLGNQIVDRISESAHVINGRIVQQTVGGEVYTMRPMDVFTGIQSGYLAESYQAYSPGASFDDRRFKSVGDPVRSNRGNNLPGQYLAKVIDSHRQGSQMLEFGQDQANLMQRASSLCYEESVIENPFLRALANIKGVVSTTIFTAGDLFNLDPNVANVTDNIRLMPTAAAQIHQAGSTSYWNGADLETLNATILSNGVPALMMEYMLTGIYIRSTNHDIGGHVNTAFAEVKSLTNMDMSANVELFRRRLESEILFDITHGNQELFTLEMRVDLFGETRLSLSFAGKPSVEYVTPSFCDSLLSPVITTSQQNFLGVVHDLEVITQSLVRDNGVTPSAYNAAI